MQEYGDRLRIQWKITVKVAPVVNSIEVADAVFYQM